MDLLPYRNHRKHAEEMSALLLRTIEAFSLAVDARDEGTRAHLHRVQVFVLAIGKELGLDSIELEALKVAALVHDIGKLGIPEHIIRKPGRLTPEEFHKMKMHTVIGAEILEQVRFPYPVAPIVRSHHEKWDGSGYPDGFKEHEIPIGARILSAVDYFDALISDRAYRRAMPPSEAMKVVEREAGKSFDPQVVNVLKSQHLDLEKLVEGCPSRVPSSNLSTEVRAERDLEPARGFVDSGAKDNHEAAFLASIAAARQEAQTLFELSQDLGASLSLSETLSVFSVKLRLLVPYDAIAIYVRRIDELIPEYVNGDNFRLFSSLRIPIGQGLSGWVAHNKKPIINGNPSVEPGYLNDPTKIVTLRSALSVPLEGIAGIVGVITLYQQKDGAFNVDHLRILLAVSAKMALSIENSLKYREAENIAHTDYATGLPNIPSFYAHLERELARSRRDDIPRVVVIFELISIDDSRAPGDYKVRMEALKMTSQAMKASLTKDDFVARTGDKEFTAIFTMPTSDEALKRANQVVDRIASLSENRIQLAVIGASVFPIDAESAESLLEVAYRRRDAMEPLRVRYAEDGQECTRSLRVFLCHSSADKPLVRDLFRRLCADGVDAWLDETKLLPGQDWKNKIREAVRASDAVVVCLSKRSVTREGFVQAELRYALDVADEKPEGTIYLNPLLLEDCDVPDRLRQWQWVSQADPLWYSNLLRSLALRATLVRNP
jgi:putative nucleotidyltransferase with HDIG domain